MMKVKVIRHNKHIYITKLVDVGRNMWQVITTIDPTVTYVGGNNGITTIDKYSNLEIVQLMLGIGGIQGYSYEFELD